MADIFQDLWDKQSPRDHSRLHAQGSLKVVRLCMRATSVGERSLVFLVMPLLCLVPLLGTLAKEFSRICLPRKARVTGVIQESALPEASLVSHHE